MQTCIDWMMAPTGSVSFVNSIEILRHSHYMKVFCTVSLGDGAICNTKNLIITISYCIYPCMYLCILLFIRFFLILQMVLLPTNFFPLSIFQKVQNVQKV